MIWFLCLSHIFDLYSCSSTVQALEDPTVVNILVDPEAGPLRAVAAMYWAAADCSTVDPARYKFAFKFFAA
jgi:hypothetical protein